MKSLNVTWLGPERAPTIKVFTSTHNNPCEKQFNKWIESIQKDTRDRHITIWSIKPGWNADGTLISIMVLYLNDKKNDREGR